MTYRIVSRSTALAAAAAVATTACGDSLGLPPAAIDNFVDTLTLYVGPQLLEPQAEAIVRLKPGRVILNPGTESRAVQQRLSEAGIEWFEACTLVMIRTGQF